jgi:hypothetical protein
MGLRLPFLVCSHLTLRCLRRNVRNANHESFPVANNFWGKDDAGVIPLMERMHNAKVTCDELKAFYSSMYSHSCDVLRDADDSEQRVLRSKMNMLESSSPSAASL